MRFEVPQFIEIEDKIFGPLTWRQFIYVGGAAGIATVLFFMTPLLVFAIIGIPIMAFAFLLGFYPVNNRSFSIFLESIFKFTTGGKLYLWRKRGTGVYKGDETETLTPQTVTAYTPPEKNSLQSLSRELEIKAMDPS